MELSPKQVIPRCQEIFRNIPTSSEDAKCVLLQELAEILIYADLLVLSALPKDELCAVLLECLQSTENVDIWDFATTCMVNFLENFSVTFLLSTGAIGAFAKMFDKGVSNSVAGNCIKVMKHMVDSDANIVAESFGVYRLFKVFDNLRFADQKSALYCIACASISNVQNEVSIYLPRICEMLNAPDAYIAKHASTAFVRILPKVTVESIPAIILDHIQEYINETNDFYSLESVISAMMDVSKNWVYFSQLIVDKKLNFSRLFLDFKKLGAKSIDIPSKVINLLLNIFPSAGFPPEFWDKPHECATGLGEFADLIYPLAKEFFLKSNGNEKLAISLICVCQRLNGRQIPIEVFTKAGSLLQDVSFTPFALLLSLCTDDLNFVRSSGLYWQLKLLRPTHASIISWYEEKLAVLVEKIGVNYQNSFKGTTFNNIEEIIDFIKNNNFTAFEFDEADLITQSIHFLENQATKPTTPNLKPLLDVCHDLATTIPLPTLPDPFFDKETSFFSKGIIALKITKDDISDSIEIRNVGLFVAIEAWYNKEKNNITASSLPRDRYLGLQVDADYLYRLSLTEIGLLHRAFNTPGYQKFKFKMGEHTYSYLDFLYPSFIRSLESPADFKKTIPTIELVDQPEDEEQLLIEGLKTQEFKQEKTINLLKLISIISQKSPDLNVTCPIFENRCKKQVTFFNTIGRFCSPVMLISDFPLAFSLSFRVLMYKLTSLDYFSALSVACPTIFNNPEQLREGRMHIPIQIRRDSIFEDGITVLRNLGPGCFQFDISFDNEPGFGAGPTHEFFDLMAKEFSKKKYKMWRSTKNVEEEFTFSESGYFPMPDASPDLFYILGILCGKALQIGIALPIPLGTAFFKFLRGETVQVKDVDPIFAKSLQNKEGLIGLNFVYPGENPLELVPDGLSIVVTEENCDEYIDLVTDFTVGSKLDDIRKRFLDGFHKVVLKGMEKILFSADEMKNLLTGDNIIICMQDLIDNIVLEHGYTANSPEVKMLFETIIEMGDQDKTKLFKFITGCERLPIGGLAGIHPKVSVARRVLERGQHPDEALPTVSTCTNYFKMPAYSHKDILKKKLLLAITEGQGSFLLS